jgi:hypothetical protein
VLGVAACGRRFECRGGTRCYLSGIVARKRGVADRGTWCLRAEAGGAASHNATEKDAPCGLPGHDTGKVTSSAAPTLESPSTRRHAEHAD